MKTKGLIFTLLFVVLSVSRAFGAVEFFQPDSDSFELDGGLKIDFAGVVRDLKAKDEASLNCVYSFFLVTARNDMMLDVKSDALYDSLGRKFEGPVGVSIIGSGTPSEIIGGVPTLVWVVHKVPVDKGELPAFAKMSFWFNDNLVELRSQKTLSWEVWKQRIAVGPVFEAWFASSPSASVLYNGLQSSHYQGGSKVFDGHHYKVFTDEKLSWNAANTKCKAMGGHLVTITSQREQDFIDTLYTTAYDTTAWIGLFRTRGYRDNGPFEWVTEEPITYTRWTDGAPYQDDYYDSRRRQCWMHYVYIFTNKAKKNWWSNDENANELRYYICEWDY